MLQHLPRLIPARISGEHRLGNNAGAAGKVGSLGAGMESKAKAARAVGPHFLLF